MQGEEGVRRVKGRGGRGALGALGGGHEFGESKCAKGLWAVDVVWRARVGGTHAVGRTGRCGGRPWSAYKPRKG